PARPRPRRRGSRHAEPGGGPGDPGPPPPGGQFSTLTSWALRASVVSWAVVAGGPASAVTVVPSGRTSYTTRPATSTASPSCRTLQSPALPCASAAHRPGTFPGCSLATVSWTSIRLSPLVSTSVDLYPCGGPGM